MKNNHLDLISIVLDTLTSRVAALRANIFAWRSASKVIETRIDGKLYGRKAILFLAIIFCFQIFVCAQEPSPSPTPSGTPEATPAPTPTPTADPVQERIDELEKQTKLEKAQKDLIDAQRARIKAYLPTSETKALEGKIEFDDKVTFSSEKMAYDSLNVLAEKIAPQINKAVADFSQPIDGRVKPNVVVVLGDTEIKALQNYNQTLAQIRGLSIQYKNLSSNNNGFEFGGAALGMIPEIATAFTKSAIDFISLFRTDVNIKGLEFSMETQSITAALVNSGGKNFYDPAMYPLGLTDDLIYQSTGLPSDKSALLQALGILLRSKNNAERIIAGNEAKQNKTPAEEESAKQLSAIFKPLNEQVDKFLADLVKEKDDGTNKLNSLVLAESIKTVLADPDKASFVLRLKVIRAAGTNTTKRNLFTGTKLSFTGGTIIRYCLFDVRGQMIPNVCGVASDESRAKLKL